MPRNKIQSPFSYSALFTQICLLEKKYNAVPQAGAKEHLKFYVKEKIPSQANSLWPWHLSKKKTQKTKTQKRKKLVWDVKFCTLNPQRLFIPHNLYRNPQETAKSISFEIGSAYTQNRCSSCPAHMANFIWPF